MNNKYIQKTQPQKNQKIPDLIKGEINLTQPAIILFGAFVLSFLSYKNLDKINNGYHADNSALIVGIVLESIALFLFYMLLSINLLLYRNEVLYVYSIFGFLKHKIERNKILYWSESAKQNKYSQWYELTLYLPNKHYKITSSLYKNYYSLRHVLIMEKKRNVQAEKKAEKIGERITAICFIGFGLFMLAFGIYSLINRGSNLAKQDLMTIKKPVISEVNISSSRSSHWIDLKLKDYPGFYFKIDNAAYKACAIQEFITKVKSGDTLSIGISRKDFAHCQQDLSSEKIWTEGDNIEDINVYALTDTHRNYLTFEAFKKAQYDSDFDSFLTGIILGIIFSLAGFAIYPYNARNSTKSD